MLKKILGLVTRPPVPAVAGILIAVAVIWFGGNLLNQGLGWPSKTVILVLCIAVVVLGGLALVLRRLRARQKARAIENEIRAQAQTQIAMVRPDRQGDFDELQRRFDEALESLKTSKLGRGALYAMPWYVIIGPPGSGKTTAITESGLNFPTFKGPQQKRGIRGLGGTRNCDWWFTDQAILLDTAGRYTTEAEDRDEWFAFLGMIKRARKLKPINGVMVAISIADVLAADEAGLEKHAETIRQRIDELVKQLEVVFPVYLVFTKCDLLDGFVEFFGAMSKEGRGQVWGATFDQRPQGEPMHEAFAREFDLLCQQADQERNRLLVADRPARQQKKVFSLPLQLRAARRKLVEFARLLTQPNPYSEASDLRGFYLTSGTQEGAPIDIVLQSMSKAFGLQPQADTTGGEHVEAKSYFIRDLFSKVMFADRELAHSSASVMKRRRLIRIGAITGSVAAMLLLGLNSVLRYSSTRGLLHEAQAAVVARRAQAIDPLRQGPPEQAAMAGLNELRDRYLALQEAYSPASILGPAWNSLRYSADHYARGLQAAFLQPAKDHVERKLREYASSPPRGPEAAGKDDYTTCSQLLLFYRALDRALVPDEQLNTAINQQNLWKWAPAELGKPATTVDSSEESRHLQAYIRAPRTEGDTWLLGNDKALIAQVEQKLNSTGGLETFLRKELVNNPDKRRRSDEDLAKDIVERVKQEGGKPDLSKEEEDKAVRTGLALRKQIEFESVAAIGLSKRGSLEDISTSLADLDKEDSALLVALREALGSLRTAKALPMPGLTGDPVAEAYKAALKQLATLRKPVDDLITGRTPGQRILPDLLQNKQELLQAFGQKLTEVRTAVKLQLEKMAGSSGVTIGPIKASLDGIEDTIVEGLARELRAETEAEWQRMVGSDLTAIAPQFPFKRELAAEDVAPAKFQDLFRPAGKIDKALAMLQRVQTLQDFGRKLDSSDRFAAFEARVRSIQAACFDPAAAQGPARVQFHVGTMTMGKDFSDLILTITTGEVVKKSSGTPAMIEKPTRTWTIGNQGASLAMELTLKENGQNVLLTVPPQGDTRTLASQWAFLRVLVAGEASISPEAVKFTWTRKWAPTNETEDRVYTASVALRPEGSSNPFDPGFFVLQVPEQVFKAGK